MQELLSKTDWSAVFKHNNINDVWVKFKNILSHVVNVSIPFKRTKSWRIKSSSKIRSALRFTRGCYSLYKSSNSKESLLQFIHSKDHLQHLIDEQIRSFEKNIIDSLYDNPKNYWSYVNSKLMNQRNFLNSLKNDKGNIDEPKLMSEVLNDYFYTSFNHSAKTALLVNANDDDNDILENVEISFETVKWMIKCLSNKCSEDLDGFSYLVLKGGGDILSLQLTRLFTFSLSVGKIPHDWKKSVIYPIRKKTNSKKVEDYRPINPITPTIGRSGRLTIKSVTAGKILYLKSLNSVTFPHLSS